MLDEKKNNYIMCICKSLNQIAISALDITTGKFLVTDIEGNYTASELTAKMLDEISRFSPKEIILNEEIFEDKKLINHLENILNIYLSKKPNMYFEADEKEKEMLKNRYILKEKRLKNSVKDKKQGAFVYSFDQAEEIELDIEDVLKTVEEQKADEYAKKTKNIIEMEEKSQYFKVIYAMDKYIKETQMSDLVHIKDIQKYSFLGYMALDSIARKNLEINARLSDQNKKGSLLWVLDKTNTSMGARFLTRILNDPLLDKIEIEKRLDAVEELKTDVVLKGNIIELLRKIYDIERISGKIAFGNVNGKDMITLKNSIMYLPQLKESLKQVNCSILKEFREFRYTFRYI